MSERQRGSWQNPSDHLRPGSGTARRQLPGSVVAAAGAWGCSALVALWSGIDVFGNARPETSGIDSGDLASSDRPSVSVPDLISLVGGVFGLIGVALLLLGLGWVTYLLYGTAAVTVVTLALSGHMSALAVAVFMLFGGVLLMGPRARAFLTGRPVPSRSIWSEDDQTDADGAGLPTDESISSWLAEKVPSQTAAASGPAAETGRTGESQAAPEEAGVRPRPRPRPHPSA